MKNNSQRVIWVLGVSTLVLVSCAQKKPAPTIRSSAESRGYATEFPMALNGQTFQYKESEGALSEKTTVFEGYPDILTDPDWKVVRTAVEAADQEGRGQAYANRVAEVRYVEQFFSREKETITKRINGAVTAAAEKADCAGDLESYGKISYALKDTVDKKLDERLMEDGEAHRIIDENEKAVGKKNIDPLKEQVSNIAYCAHVAYVLLPQTYGELERRLSEVKKVKATLQDAIEAETAAAAEPKISKKEKKAREKSVEELKAALAAVDGYEQEAEKLVTRAETDIPKVQEQYDTAFEALVTKIKSNAGK